MWALHNETPYAAERNWIRDKSGVHWWLVAVRATFEVGPRGALRLADEQPLPTLEPEYVAEAGSSSLLYDSDLLAIKPTTDVVLIGSAHAPGGRPAKTVPVTLRVGAMQKTLLVHGDRVYYDGAMGLTTTTPAPFVSQPIRYELAFGGGDTSNPDPSRHRIDERNPIGRGFGNARALANTKAHVIEYDDGRVAGRGPAGFGPIDRGWFPRRPLAGTYDARWVETRKPLLPEDYDDAFALSSPVDQRLPTPLVGGEPMGLHNLVPEGTLAFAVPCIRLALTSRIGRYTRPHGPPLLSTVHIDADKRLLSVTWQSGLRVPSADCEFLDRTRIVEESAA